MAHSWILNVLTDLQIYARENDLSDLAEALREAHGKALTETVLKSRETVPVSLGAGHGELVRRISGDIERCG